MAEQGSRTPASDETEIRNLKRLGLIEGERASAPDISARLRKELKEKGLSGFKRGGNVKKTGVYKLHKGEKVVTAAAAKKAAASPTKPAAKKPTPKKAAPQGRRR